MICYFSRGIEPDSSYLDNNQLEFDYPDIHQISNLRKVDSEYERLYWSYTKSCNTAEYGFIHFI